MIYNFGLLRSKLLGFLGRWRCQWGGLAVLASWVKVIKSSKARMALSLVKTGDFSLVARCSKATMALLMG